MLINFANENLIKEILSDKPCLDSNDVTNLTSLDPVTRNKGFLVEYFVKPPVVISIEFICSITISHIMLNCQVGEQKSSLIEVFTKTRGTNKKIIVAKKNFGENEKIANFVVHGGHYKDPSYVTFRLSKYVCNVNEVAIRILRTQSSTLAALGKIEIWGKPSRTVEKDVIKGVYEIWKKIKEGPTIKVNIAPQLPSKKPVFRYCREIKEPHVDIPEEFFDPITCEVLILPMTLPSGKIVDASTIERFNKEQEKLGHLPSDPFTGKIFTDISYPVAATSLKARLDQFFLNHSHISSLQSIPRTIGRAPSSSVPFKLVKDLPPPPSSSSSSSSPSSSRSIKNINQLLDSCLSGLPTFLEKSPVNSVKVECCKCNCPKLLFKLTCNHLICRNCLISVKNGKTRTCTNCSKPIDYKNAERFHAA